VLAGDATYPDDADLGAVGQDQAHLEQDLELGGDDGRLAAIEALGAVATLEDEQLTAGCTDQVAAEPLDLPGGDQRRQPRELLEGVLESGLVGIGRLLGDRSRLPG